MLNSLVSANASDTYESAPVPSNTTVFATVLSVKNIVRPLQHWSFVLAWDPSVAQRRWLWL